MENEYINSRGGIMATYADRVDDKVIIETLTVREFLKLLPEKLEDEKSETD